MTCRSSFLRFFKQYNKAGNVVGVKLNTIILKRNFVLDQNLTRTFDSVFEFYVLAVIWGYVVKNNF